MGAVDLVIQVESPTSVARGLQRVGRAGHQVGASKGIIFPKYRGDLLECAVVTRRMHEARSSTRRSRATRSTSSPNSSVAMTVMDRWTGDELLATVTRAAPYESLTREVLDGVLGMLAGAYPSDEFAELKPRVVWDRLTDTIEGRRDARVVAVTSGGTIPDRGLFGVFMTGEVPGAPRRRDSTRRWCTSSGRGCTATSSSSAPAAGRGHRPRPGHGQPGARRARQAAVLEGRRGRSADRAGDGHGRLHRRGRARSRPWRGRPGRGQVRCARLHDLDELAAENLLAYLEDEREATGALPTDKRVVIERFRDEPGTGG